MEKFRFQVPLFDECRLSHKVAPCSVVVLGA